MGFPLRKGCRPTVKREEEKGAESAKTGEKERKGGEKAAQRASLPKEKGRLLCATCLPLSFLRV